MTEKENQNIEWKSSWKDEYLKWICGYANAQGGTLYIGTDDDGNVVGIDNAKDMLEIINKRISVLYDREHTIGHAYFVPLKTDNSLEQLSNIFADNIIPLLQEYFYEDYEKIRLVLGDNRKKDINTQFVKQVEYSVDELFGSEEYDIDTNVTYEINKAAFGNIDAYRLIYIR